MGKTERLQELMTTPPSQQHIEAKEQDGWKMTAVIWERQAKVGDESARDVYEVVPFGLRVADDCMHLVEDTRETEVIMLALELIVQDHPLSRVSNELNRRGFRTREGSLWNVSSVFNLLPRLIDAGPRVFTSDEWIERRAHLFQAIQQ